MKRTKGTGERKRNGSPLVPIEHVPNRTAAVMQISQLSKSEEQNLEIVVYRKMFFLPMDNTKQDYAPKKDMLFFSTFQEDAIVRNICAYYERKEKTFLCLFKRSRIISGGRTSVSFLLKRLGFKWEISSRKVINTFALLKHCHAQIGKSVYDICCQ